MPTQNGKRVHRVRQGECLSSIAVEAGLFWETVLNDSDNVALRQQRVDPNVLLPGDTIVLRPIETKYEDGATEQRERPVTSRGRPAPLTGPSLFLINTGGKAQRGQCRHNGPAGKIGQRSMHSMILPTVQVLRTPACRHRHGQDR
jgi:hypothetical protein